jgi:hypothetical protein
VVLGLSRHTNNVKENVGATLIHSICCLACWASPLWASRQQNSTLSNRQLSPDVPFISLLPSGYHKLRGALDRVNCRCVKDPVELGLFSITRAGQKHTKQEEGWL